MANTSQQNAALVLADKQSMTIEQKYYEIAEFWDEAAFAGDSGRFEELAALIPDDVSTVLDVGCGNGLFVHLLSRLGRFTAIHAADRSGAALLHVRAPKTQASIDNLPFPDRSFDIVTCLEVIEHLPEKTFAAALDSLCRIASRYLLISVPHQEDIEAALIPCPACRTRFNPDYHMRSFSQEALTSMLDSRGFRHRQTILMGPVKRYFWVTRWRQRRARNGRNPFRIAIPCPMCGHELPGSEPAQTRGLMRAKGSILKRLAQKALYNRVDYYWIAVLYERN